MRQEQCTNPIKVHGENKVSENGLQAENQSSTSGHNDGPVAYERHRPRWLVGLLIAASVLIIVTVGADLLFGRELFQRPFLIAAVVIAWLGALVGISIGSEPG